MAVVVAVLPRPPRSRDKLSAVAMVLIAAGAAFVAVPGERRYAGESVPGLILVGVGLGMCTGDVDIPQTSQPMS